MNDSIPDIFISYSSKDREWVASLAQALKSCRFNVWWDRELVVGQNYHEGIEQALEQTRCVVTVWSENSVNSKWVLGESSRGDERSILVPLIYRQTNIPTGFRAYHNADFQSWQGDVQATCFQELVRGIEQVLELASAETGLVPAQPVNVNVSNDPVPVQLQQQVLQMLGQNISQRAIDSFFRTLEVQHVPQEEYGQKLQEIAQSYRDLKERLADVQTSDEAIAALTQQADEAIDNGQFAEAKSLLGQAEQQVMDSYVENRLLTAAEIAATKGELAKTQLQYLAMGEAYEDAANKMGALGEKHFEKWSEYLNGAGTGLEEAGQYRRAEPIYEKALGLREKHLPQNHSDIAASLNNLANLYLHQGRYDEAEPLYQRSLSISEKVLGKDHPDVATMLNNLALLYESQGRYDEAEPLYQRSLSISEKALGKDHPDVATMLNNLASLYKSQDRYDEAEPLYQRSLSISEKALGKDHPSVATTLNNLAELYRQQERYDEAEPLYQRDLSISEKALGKDHPSVATTLNNLALLYKSQGRYGEAEPLYQRSLSIREDKLGKDHPEVATTLHNLGLLFFHQGKLQQSADYQKQALTILKKTFSDEHPDVKLFQGNLDYVKQQIQN